MQALSDALQAATSFECDGCTHHASFHSLENPAEDAVLKKWAQQEADDKEIQAVTGANKKRKMITQGAMPEADEDVLRFAHAEGASATERKRKGRKAKAGTVNSSTAPLDLTEE